MGTQGYRRAGGHWCAGGRRGMPGYGRGVDGNRLSDEETALVLRRAAELDSVTDPHPVGLDAAALEDVAVEAGLSRQSVRRALAELHLGTLVAPPGGRRSGAARLFGPGTVVVHRAVPAPVRSVEAPVREYLESQLFRVVRDIGGQSLWSPREDLKASVQRSVDRKMQHRLVLGDVCRIQVAVTAEGAPGDGWSLVHFEIDVGDVRRASGRMVLVSSTLGVVAAGGALVVAGIDPVAIVALPAAAAGSAYVGHRRGTSHYRLRVHQIETAVQGMLDGVGGPATSRRRH